MLRVSILVTCHKVHYIYFWKFRLWRSLTRLISFQKPLQAVKKEEENEMRTFFVHPSLDLECWFLCHRNQPISGHPLHFIYILLSLMDFLARPRFHKCLLFWWLSWFWWLENCLNIGLKWILDSMPSAGGTSLVINDITLQRGGPFRYRRESYAFSDMCQRTFISKPIDFRSVNFGWLKKLSILFLPWIVYESHWYRGSCRL